MIVGRAFWRGFWDALALGPVWRWSLRRTEARIAASAPRFKVGDTVCFHIVPGGRAWKGKVVSVDASKPRPYLVHSDVSPADFVDLNESSIWQITVPDAGEGRCK